MDMRKVGAKLALLRGKKRREEVANAVGVSVSALAQYEYGNRVPRDAVKEALARYYGCSVAEIFFEDKTH